MPTTASEDTGCSTTTIHPVADIVAHFGAIWAERERARTLAGEFTNAPETIDEIRTSGILSAPIPIDAGGGGATLSDCADAIRLLATKAPATALTLAMPLGNAATAQIPAHMVPADKRAELAIGQQWIVDHALAGRILAVANSEPGTGGDLSQVKTKARVDHDGQFRLTGRKAFATIGPDADYFLCSARHNAHGKDAIDGFFIHRHAPGLRLLNDWDPLGMRITASIGLELDDVPASAVLGYHGCIDGINARHWATVLFAAISVGTGQGAIAEAVGALAKSAAQSPYTQTKLAEATLNLDAAQAFVESAARDGGWPQSPRTRERNHRAKSFAAKTAVEAATVASTLSGGRAYHMNHPISRFLHDALAGPLLRLPLPRAMDNIATQLFPPLTAR